MAVGLTLPHRWALLWAQLEGPFSTFQILHAARPSLSILPDPSSPTFCSLPSVSLQPLIHNLSLSLFFFTFSSLQTLVCYLRVEAPSLRTGECLWSPLAPLACPPADDKDDDEDVDEDGDGEDKDDDNRPPAQSALPSCPKPRQPVPPQLPPGKKDGLI